MNSSIPTDNEFIAEEVKNLFCATPRNISNMNVRFNQKWKEIEHSLYDLEMSIRSLPKGQVKFFSRDNQIQKVILPTHSYAVCTNDEDNDDEMDFIEVPKLIYTRFVMLVCDQISDIPISLARCTFNVNWEFAEKESGWEFTAEVDIERELHLPRMASRLG